jgi:hypothetical protein
MKEKKLKILGVTRAEFSPNVLLLNFNKDFETKWIRMIFDAALERAQRPVKIKKINRPVKRVNTW